MLTIASEGCLPERGGGGAIALGNEWNVDGAISRKILLFKLF